MIGIGTIIGIAASIFQTVQSMNRSDATAQKSDQLFSQIDLNGKGEITGSDLQNAFDKIATKASVKSDELFAKLDTDGDGVVSKTEFSSSLNRLAEQLDQHYANMRLQSAITSNPGFSKDELSSMASNLTSNFEKADADGDGRLSVKEATTFLKENPPAAQASPLADNQNVELMLQVMRLMQAYGVQQAPKEANTAAQPRVSSSA